MKDLVKAYYSAVNQVMKGNVEPMLALWRHDDEVSLMLSLGEREHGWKAVSTLWGQIAKVLGQSPMQAHIEPTEVNIQECGDVVYGIILEQVKGSAEGPQVSAIQRCTVIWRRAEDGWKIVHVHNDAVQSQQEFLSYLLRHHMGGL